MEGVVYALLPLFVLGGFATGVLMERGGRRRNIRRASELVKEVHDLERENLRLNHLLERTLTAAEQLVYVAGSQDIPKDIDGFIEMMNDVVAAEMEEQYPFHIIMEEA